jgi:hypothetical protein
MSLEMVDTDALDTGEYHAMVIQDPTDKKNVRGFFHLALARPYSMRHRNVASWEDRMNWGILRLARRMNEWTAIETDVTHRLTFDNSELFDTPWVYLMVMKNIQPTESEIRNLGKYLAAGGFFMAEGDAIIDNRGLQGYRSLRHFIYDALASQGWIQHRDWCHDILPNSHPLFHVYYDFERSPGKGMVDHPDGTNPTVRGVIIEGRLVVITTNLKYGLKWGSFGPGGHPATLDIYGLQDPKRLFEFGINTIIFALTQEGSITKRVMDGVSY